MTTPVYFNTENLELAQTLRKHWMAIRDEAEALFAEEGEVPKVNARMEGQDGRYMESVGVPKYTGTNASIHLQVVPDLLDPPEARIALSPAGVAGRLRRQKKCPMTMGILAPYGEHVGNIGFNRLHPGARINPHYGVITSNRFVRIHLGLRTDPGATFFAKDHASYTWKDGETMAFDDATVLHWVEHHGQSSRLILCLDVAKAAFPNLEAL
jgi:aspartyl/asparaginyl beta-hydroxylase (cupin superfamily)